MLLYNRLCFCYVIFYQLYKEKLTIKLVFKVVCKKNGSNFCAMQ
jgi:hypothetical protein